MSGPAAGSALEPVSLDVTVGGAVRPSPRVLATAIALSLITRRPLVPFDSHSREEAALLDAVRPFFVTSNGGKKSGSVDLSDVRAGLDGPTRLLVPEPSANGEAVVSAEDFGLVADALLTPLSLRRGTTLLTLRRSAPTAVIGTADLGFYELALVQLPLLRGFGIHANVSPVVAHDGGVSLSLYPAPRITAAELNSRGVLRDVTLLPLVASVGQGFAGQLERHARRRLRARGIEAEGRVLPLVGTAAGIGLAVVATFERSRVAFLSPGGPGRAPEEVADRAVDALEAHLESRGVLDPVAAERALLVSAVAASPFGAPGAIGAVPQPSSFSTSSITKTLLQQAIVVKAFLGVDVEVTGGEGDEGTVRLRPSASSG